MRESAHVQITRLAKQIIIQTPAFSWGFILDEIVANFIWRLIPDLIRIK